MHLTLRAHGDASPEVVWERYSDLERWHEWSPQVSSVEAGGKRLKAGLTGVVVGSFGVRVPFRVVEVGIRSWAWEVRPLGMRLVLDHRVLPRLDGSATELRMTGPAPALVAYAPLARAALRKLVAW